MQIVERFHDIVTIYTKAAIYGLEWGSHASVVECSKLRREEGIPPGKIPGGMD